MSSYVILLRGINVGGKNKIPMSELKSCLEEEGFENVVTYIQSGNVVLSSEMDSEKICEKIENILPKRFKLDSTIIKVTAFSHNTFKEIVMQAPEGFGRDSANCRYNVLFLINCSPGKAMEQITTRQGVDDARAGDNAIYFRNSIQNASKSHLSRITQQPVYQSITIRNWNTTIKLLQLLEEHEKQFF